jgi:hypothetical protein
MLAYQCRVHGLSCDHAPGPMSTSTAHVAALQQHVPCGRSADKLHHGTTLCCPQVVPKHQQLWMASPRRLNATWILGYMRDSLTTLRYLNMASI